MFFLYPMVNTAGFCVAFRTFFSTVFQSDPGSGWVSQGLCSACGEDLSRGPDRPAGKLAKQVWFLTRWWRLLCWTVSQPERGCSCPSSCWVSQRKSVRDTVRRKEKPLTLGRYLDFCRQVILVYSGQEQGTTDSWGTGTHEGQRSRQLTKILEPKRVENLRYILSCVSEQM